MPYIGHREPDLSDLGISPADTPAPDADTTLTDVVRRIVGRAAHDSDDEHLLLEALGLIPTVHAEHSLAG